MSTAAMVKPIAEPVTLSLDQRIAAALAPSAERLPTAAITGLMNEVLRELDRTDQIGREARARIDSDGGAMGKAHDSEYRAHQLRDWQGALMSLMYGGVPKDVPTVAAWRPWKGDPDAPVCMSYEERLEAHKQNVIADGQWLAKICADRNDAKRRIDREAELRAIAASQKKRDAENGF